MNWQYSQPVSIRFGCGERKCLSEIVNNIGGKHGLFVTSRSFIKRGVAAEITADCPNVEWTIYSEVSPNPDVKECEAAITHIRKQQCDFVVALGGGSVMDLAKAASALCFSESSVSDTLTKKASVPTKHLPLIALPTTAGTGSEVTSVAVLTDHELGLKAPMSSDSFFPKIAIVDPELTLSVPPRLTAQTGFDTLCHAIEAYWGKHHQPVCDVLAVEAARLVLENIERTYKYPEDLSARENMAQASVTAGLAFALPKTSSAHACSYPLTNRLGIAHGEACAMTIAYFIRFNASHGCQRTMRLANLLGFASAEELANRIDELKTMMGMRQTLADMNLTDNQFQQLVDESMHPNLANNPIIVSRKDLVEMYNMLIKY